VKYNTSEHSSQYKKFTHEGRCNAGEQHRSAGVSYTAQGGGIDSMLYTVDVPASIPAGSVVAPKLKANPTVDGPSPALLDTVRTTVQADPIQAITGRKRESVKLARRIESFDKKRAGRMMQCGSSFTRDVTTCDHSHSSALRRTDRRCTDRLCPQCARIRSIRLSGALSEPLKALQGGNALYAYHVGLTWADTEHLPEFKTINGWKRAILKSSFFKRYGYFGAIVSLEVKIGAGSGLWHPHFHCVVFTRKPIATYKAERNGREVHLFDNAINEELSGAWETINGGAGYIVQGEAFDGNYTEILKYITDSCHKMNDTQLKEFCTWSHGRRFLSMAGKLYANAQLKELMNKADEDDGEDEEKQEDTACPHCGCIETRREHLFYDERRGRFIIDDTGRAYTPPQREGPDWILPTSQRN
jgi:hypothetical protein